nr:hypothetical protein [Tanacetum cinerariifolium]
GEETAIPESYCHQVHWLSTWKNMYMFKVNPCHLKKKKSAAELAEEMVKGNKLSKVEHRASMEAYKKVHGETVRTGLRMAIVQQSMEMDKWEIKEKLAKRQEQMDIRAYEEDKRREEWIQNIEEDKRREEWIQKIEDVINLIQSFN